MIRRTLNVLHRRGWSYPGYILLGVLAPRLGYRFFALLPERLSGRRVMLLGFTAIVASSALAWLLGFGLELWVGLAVLVLIASIFALSTRGGPPSNRGVQVENGRETWEGRFLPWREWVEGEELTADLSTVLSSPSSSEVVLGRLDDDGRLLSSYGKVPGFERVERSEFVERYRYDLDLVLVDGLILIRKAFRSDRAGYLREVSALRRLDSNSRVPGVFRADDQKLLLYKSFIPGRTLREHLVEKGAAILNHQVTADPRLAELTPSQRVDEVWSRGRRELDRWDGGSLMPSLERELDRVHGEGVTGFSLTFGNVVLRRHTQDLWFIDFDRAHVHPAPSGPLYHFRRDQDRQLFNRIYGRSLLTESTARRWLGQQRSSYSPIDLGRGLVTRGFWSVDSGMGRWEYLNRRVLTDLLPGRRILDLGSNNGVMSLMMARDGAARVVGLERDERLVSLATEMKEVFQWRDMRVYDVEFRQADMRSIATERVDQFDIVTAYCSLYYLEEQDMAEVAKAVLGIAPVFVVQAKTDTRAQATQGKARKSSVEFLRQLLQDCGFHKVRVVSEEGFTRPLILAEAG